jgi:hypothetical protein
MKKFILSSLGLLLSICSLAQGDEKGPVNSYYTPFTALDNFNGGGVVNNPSAATTFTVAYSCLITTIQTYHWNNGRGAPTGTIKLVHANGTVYGPWTATGIAGSGGVTNAFWSVTPNSVIPAGTYTVVDSDKATWSCNGQSLNKGFAKVFARRK